MGKKVLLVDVDGTVLDKELMWEQLEDLFQDSFPKEAKETSLRSYYDSHKGKDHLVEKVVKTMVGEFRVEEEKLKQIFEQVDYEQCFKKDVWGNIRQWVRDEEGEIVFFTQGSEWVQQAKRRQMDKFLQKDEYFLQDDYVWYICDDNKMDHLDEIKRELSGEGKTVIGLADDLDNNICRAEIEHGLPRCFRL